MATRKVTRTPARKVTARKTTARKVVSAKVYAWDGDEDDVPGDEDDYDSMSLPATSKNLSYRQRGWYMPNKDGDGFLSGLKCPICQRAFKKGQGTYAWAGSISDRYGRRVQKLHAMHGVCMAVEAESSPYDKFMEIRDRLKGGGGLFE